jgi:hypothetical protein
MRKEMGPSWLLVWNEAQNSEPLPRETKTVEVSGKKKHSAGKRILVDHFTFFFESRPLPRPFIRSAAAALEDQIATAATAAAYAAIPTPGRVLFQSIQYFVTKQRYSVSFSITLVHVAIAIMSTVNRLQAGIAQSNVIAITPSPSDPSPVLFTQLPFLSLSLGDVCIFLLIFFSWLHLLRLP